MWQVASEGRARDILAVLSVMGKVGLQTKHDLHDEVSDKHATTFSLRIQGLSYRLTLHKVVVGLRIHCSAFIIVSTKNIFLHQSRAEIAYGPQHSPLFVVY